MPSPVLRAERNQGKVTDLGPQLGLMTLPGSAPAVCLLDVKDREKVLEWGVCEQNRHPDLSVWKGDMSREVRGEGLL